MDDHEYCSNATGKSRLKLNSSLLHRPSALSWNYYMPVGLCLLYTDTVEVNDGTTDPADQQTSLWSSIKCTAVNWLFQKTKCDCFVYAHRKHIFIDLAINLYLHVFSIAHTIWYTAYHVIHVYIACRWWLPLLQLKGQAYGFSFNTSSIHDFWIRQCWSPVFIVFHSIQRKANANAQPRVYHVHEVYSVNCHFIVQALTIKPSTTHFSLQ